MGFGNGYDSGYSDAIDDVRNGKVAGLGPIPTPTPTPTPSAMPTVTDIGEGFFHSGYGNVVTGENMRFADGDPGNHVVVKNGTGVDMEAMVSTDTRVPVTETGFSLNIDEGTPLTDSEEYTFEFAMVDSAGQPVTVTHTARYQSE
jgi:hypothetical protein